MSQKAAYFAIGMAAILWGIIGLFVSQLYASGFSTIQIVAIRALTASFFLALVSVIKNRQLPKIDVKDSRYFIGTGIFSFVLFNWCLFSAVRETSISVATILLYTAPAFVTVLSVFLFREKFTYRKTLALCITLIGCSLVAGTGQNNTKAVTFYGLVLGIASGFFYALYSIFGKFALQKYDSLTVSFYTFVFAAAAILPFSHLWEAMPLFLDYKTWLYILGLGFISTSLAFLLYTKGLNQVESSRAAIVATLEPVVAALVGFLFFKESLHFWQYAGIGLVISAVIIVQEFPGNSGKNSPNS